MNNATQFILECPGCRENISVPKRSNKLDPSEEIPCVCGWKGAAEDAKVRRVLPFTWIYSAASTQAPKNS
jgi:hypothetical protein